MARSNPLEFDEDGPARRYQRQHDPDLFKKFVYRTLSNVITVVASAVILAGLVRLYVMWSFDSVKRQLELKNAPPPALKQDR